MARIIIDCAPNEIPDHRNRDTLDNRRSNLRKATFSQNNYNTTLFSNNTSGFRGVHWVGKSSKWKAEIGACGRRFCLGSFLTKEEAYEAYVKASRELHGDFANL